MAATIHLICFGITRDILGGAKVTLEIEEPVTVVAVRQRLETHYPVLQQLASLRFAYQEAYVEEDFPLKDQAELVLIPPVSGG